MQRRFLALVGCLVACGGRSALEPGKLGLSGEGGAGASSKAGGAGKGGSSFGGSGVGGSSTGGVSIGGTPIGGTPIGGTPIGGMPIGGMPIAGMAMGGAAGENPCPNGSGDEVCNGTDDDCDGEIDEDLPLEIRDEPLAVRVDEGRTNDPGTTDCISCSWAWRPQLVDPGDQLGVVWYLGINGGYEQPSGFYRRLSWELEPQGEVGSVGSTYFMKTWRRGATSGRGTLLTFFARIDGDDVASVGFVDAALQAGATARLADCQPFGNAFSLTPLLPGLVSCNGEDQVHLIAIGEQGNVVTGYAVRPELADGSPAAAGRAVAAMRGARGLVAIPLQQQASPISRQLLTVEIAADGAPLAEPRVQDLGIAESMTLNLQGLFAQGDGYLLFGDHRTFGAWPGGRFVIPLSSDGTLGEPFYNEDSALEDFSEVAVARAGNGFIVAQSTPAGLGILQLEANGQSLLTAHYFDVSAYSEASLLFSHGHLYAAWAEEPPLADAPNRIDVLRLSCRR